MYPKPVSGPGRGTPRTTRDPALFACYIKGGFYTICGSAQAANEMIRGEHGHQRVFAFGHSCVKNVSGGESDRGRCVAANRLRQHVPSCGNGGSCSRSAPHLFLVLVTSRLRPPG